MSKRNNFSIIRKVGAFAMCLSFVAILAQSAYASANIRNMPTRNLGAMQQTAGTTQTTTGAAQGAATVRAATTARATAGAGTGGGATASVGARRATVYDHIRNQAGGGLGVNIGGGTAGGGQILTDLSEIRNRVQALEDAMADLELGEGEINIIIQRILNVIEEEGHINYIVGDIINEIIADLMPDAGDGVVIDGRELNVNVGPGLEIDTDNRVVVRVGNGIVLNPDTGQLEVDLSELDITDIICDPATGNDYAIVRRRTGELDCVEIVGRI